MRTKILIAVLIVGCIIACKKNVYNSKPTIVLKSISSNLIPVNGNLTIELQVFDKEGDVTDPATLSLIKLRLNQKVVTDLVNNDTLSKKIPSAPLSQDGFIQMTLDYTNFLVSAVSRDENDTIQYKFALTDQAGNVSDTILTEPIVIIR